MWRKSQSLTNQIIREQQKLGKKAKSRKSTYIFNWYTASVPLLVTYIFTHWSSRKTLSVVTAVISFFKWNTFHGEWEEQVERSRNSGVLRSVDLSSLTIVHDERSQQLCISTKVASTKTIEMNWFQTHGARWNSGESIHTVQIWSNF